MKLAVMQPYLFPYIGYFQLINAADIFVIYDDVNYIKRGYINRNSILVSGEASRFTIPVPGASQNKKIDSLSFSKDVGKVLKSIRHAYGKAPYFGHVYPLVEQVLEMEDRSISEVCLQSYKKILNYLGIEKVFYKSSEIPYDRSKPADQKLVDICKNFSADTYINAPGGRSLYSKESFENFGLKLLFIEPSVQPYDQGLGNFIPNLSIIDCMMFCHKEQVVEMLDQYRLV